MGMSFELRYHRLVKEQDIPALSPKDRERISKAIQEKLTLQPEVFGKPLRRSLKGYRSLRVGDYRVIFRIDGEKVIIIVIGHRSVVYESTMRRLI